MMPDQVEIDCVVHIIIRTQVQQSEYVAFIDYVNDKARYLFSKGSWWGDKKFHQIRPHVGWIPVESTVFSPYDSNDNFTVLKREVIKLEDFLAEHFVDLL